MVSQNVRTEENNTIRFTLWWSDITENHGELSSPKKKSTDRKILRGTEDVPTHFNQGGFSIFRSQG